MEKWLISLFAVFGAFFLSGVCGAFIADILGIWSQPLAGFFAAFAVVSVAYLTAPINNNIYATAAFVLGALVAFGLIGDSFYPENFEGKAYQKIWFPYLATLTGGLIALGIVWFRPDRNDAQ